MDTPIRPRLIDEPGVWFGVATGLVVATYVVAGAVHLSATATALSAVAVGGGAATRLRLLAAPVLGAIAWAFFTGFVEHRYGQLTLASPDLVRLLGFALGVLLIVLLVRGGAGNLPRHHLDATVKRCGRGSAPSS
jgi:hypothetical protein